MSIIIQTPRFIVRNFLPEEEAIYVDLLLDPDVALYLPKRSREEHKQFFNMAITDYAAGKVLGKWGIFNIKDDDFIGMCLMRPFDDTGLLEIGYSLHQKYWGKGIATEMVKALIAYGFGSTNAKGIVAVTALGNMASQRVLEKAGLQRDGNIIRQNEELAYFKIAKPDL